MADRLPSAEEHALWRAAVRDAVPFRVGPKAKAVADAPEPDDPVDAAPVPAGVPVPPTLPVAPVPVPGAVRQALPPLVLGRSAGIDRRTDERLRGGALPIDGRIDLHGLTQASAHDALCRFLADSYYTGRRCVLVITGKGPIHQGGGVLRSAVPRWLAEPALRRLIIALHQARPHHGGEGALYVLLKRRRAEGG